MTLFIAFDQLIILCLAPQTRLHSQELNDYRPSTMVPNTGRTQSHAPDDPTRCFDTLKLDLQHAQLHPQTQGHYYQDDQRTGDEASEVRAGQAGVGPDRSIMQGIKGVFYILFVLRTQKYCLKFSRMQRYSFLVMVCLTSPPLFW